MFYEDFDNTESVSGNNYWTKYFAQITENYSYEYKLRLLNSHENQTQNIFNINYIIKILVEYLYSNLDVI